MLCDGRAQPSPIFLGNTPRLRVVPAVKKRSHLPFRRSQARHGKRHKVCASARCAVGADGLLIEVLMSRKSPLDACSPLRGIIVLRRRNAPNRRRPPRSITSGCPTSLAIASCSPTCEPRPKSVCSLAGRLAAQHYQDQESRICFKSSPDWQENIAIILQDDERERSGKRSAEPPTAQQSGRSTPPLSSANGPLKSRFDGRMEKRLPIR